MTVLLIVVLYYVIGLLVAMMAVRLDPRRAKTQHYMDLTPGWVPFFVWWPFVAPHLLMQWYAKKEDDGA